MLLILRTLSLLVMLAAMWLLMLHCSEDPRTHLAPLSASLSDVEASATTPLAQTLPPQPPPTPLPTPLPAPLASSRPPAALTPKPTEPLLRTDTRTRAPRLTSLIPNTTLLPDVCYHLVASECRGSMLSDGELGRVVMGAGPVLAFRFKLLSYNAENATLEVTIASCESSGVAPRNLRVNNLSSIVLDSGLPSVFTLRDGHFTEGTFVWEHLTGRFVTREDDLVKAENAEERSHRAGRKDVSWVLVPVGADSRQGKKRQLREGRRLFVLRPDTVGWPRRYPERMTNSSDGRVCERGHHGCCWPRPVSSFVQPTTADRDRFPREKSDVPRLTVVIVSSKRTFAHRKPLLERWVFDKSLVSQLVVSLDCECEALDEWLTWGPEKAKVDWLVGPMGPAPRGLSDVAVRVLMMMHWTFARHAEDWTMMVDDDSLVYGRALEWVLSALPDPKTTPLYVGHTTEWYAKTLSHGDMAFGGGGTLVSRAAAQQWLRRWGSEDGTESRRSVDQMLQSGECSHAGGDGAVCRALVASVGTETEVFIDWKGFHQFDVVGTKILLAQLRPTCPNCPSQEMMTGLFLLDTVGAQPVVTLHHLYATKFGMVYPGLHPGEAMTRMSRAYEVHPDLLPLRRLCGSSGGHTQCINFGLALQLFGSSVTAEDAMVLLDKRRPGGPVDVPLKETPQDNLDWVAPREVLKSLQCTLFYTGSRASDNDTYEHYYVADPNVLPRPDWTPRRCVANASVVIDQATWSMTAKISFEGKTLSWTEPLHPLVAFPS
eukprot:Rhum_TRINITY_DN11081_c0_g1::Rhum_TRINITY_DN11081_c0_g1_i1::g.42304::m.42304